LIDNMLNNTDWGVGKVPSRQRLVKLFDDGEAGWVRVGSGRENLGDTTLKNIRGASGNINFIDSIENKFNHDRNLRLNIPRDVAWLISNGTATDVVAFDDWTDPHYLISSEMVQAKSGANMKGDFKRIQNAATGLYRSPASGEIVGPGEVERVALGGVRGKGLFLRPSSGIRYTIPDGQHRDLTQDVWFVGLFVDPRMKNDNQFRRLLEFPDGSGIDLKGLHSVSLVSAAGERHTFALNAALAFAAHNHLGFRIHPQGKRVEVFRDGMLVADWHKPTDADPVLVMSPGELWVGRAANTTSPVNGFHGWVDELKVVGQAQDMNAEEICNHALGSVVALQTDSALQEKASAIPPMFHDGIRNATASKAKWFLCFADTRNQDGWVDLNNLPS
ncbi:hypothetical protein, partial [Alcanivorax sp. 1008]|uniref:hypothetical protein n=1 Tax=Alcanivorax sp. 1008 TaxID=2816853 RepID=UPI001E112CDF